MPVPVPAAVRVKKRRRLEGALFIRFSLLHPHYHLRPLLLRLPASIAEEEKEKNREEKKKGDNRRIVTKYINRTRKRGSAGRLRERNKITTRCCPAAFFFSFFRQVVRYSPRRKQEFGNRRPLVSLHGRHVSLRVVIWRPAITAQQRAA